jgi:hypothetical protein
MMSAFVLVLATTVGCGGGSDPAPVPTPTLTAVAPDQGSSLGGTDISLTGTNFIAGATVTVGGNPATAVVVVDPTTITCSTPAGTPGAVVDVVVTTSDGAATLAGAFTYFPAPTLANAAPPTGDPGGETPVTLTGTGFSANSAGANTVTFGGNAATSIVAVDDTTITCLSPAGASGSVAVVVTNANGTATLPDGFTYNPPMLFAAEGSGVSATLYMVNPATAATTVVGPVGLSVTGLAIAPDGTLYGAEATRWIASSAEPNLLKVDRTTGAGTIVGLMDDAGTARGLPDFDFAGTRLLGMGRRSTELYDVSTATGDLTLLGNHGLGSSNGQGFAIDAGGVGYFALGGNGSTAANLYSVDTETGVAALVAAITVPSGEVVRAMTFLQGTLYAVVGRVSNGSGGAANTLYTIDPTTAAATLVGSLPNNIDALAGNQK